MRHTGSLIETQLEQAVELHRQGRLEEARGRYEQVVQAQPKNLRAVRLLAGVWMQTGRADFALNVLVEALSGHPHDPGLRNLCGVALLTLGRYEAAIENFDQVLGAAPRDAWAWTNRGIALYELGRYTEAIESYDRALAVAPAHADALYNRGNACRSNKNWVGALASYDAAIASNPQYENAHLNRGSTLLDLKRATEAIHSYDRVIALNPHSAEAFSNRGGALLKLGRPTDALKSFDRSIELNPDSADGYFNRGNALRELKQYALAVQSYGRALARHSTARGLSGLRLNSRSQICDWPGIEADIANLSVEIAQGQPASDPFFLLSLSDSAELHRKAAAAWSKALLPAGGSPVTWASTQHDKIRVGYFSSDFREHPVAVLSAGMFEAHDRSRFEITAFALEQRPRDSMRVRLERAFDRFIELGSLTDMESARLSRDMQIDIAVDLNGYTAGARPGIFAMHAAPLQVSFLGYTSTLGADFIDYVIADRIVIPEEHQCHYTEKIIYLPHSFQVNDSNRKISEKIFTRAELGLPMTGFVFCCFNNANKIMPETFDGWMRILGRVANSVLWLLEDNAQASFNLRQRAISRGISGERLIFARRLPLPEHLARHRCAGLFLDSLPFNAHTTASDALWAGLPVLTRLGSAFSGRVAASLLEALDLSQLITSNADDYESLAVELALNPERLTHFNDLLAEHRLTRPLFDTRLFTQNLETAYRAIVARRQDNLAPAHIFLPQN